MSSIECNVCSGTASCSSCVIAAVASVIIVRHRATDLGPGLQNILQFIVRLSLSLS